jgi:hypothetical protein
MFLGAEALQNVAQLLIPLHSTLYGGMYMLSNTVLWILAYFVVLELYRLIFEDYPGIASRYRLRLSPNRRVYATGYAFYFGFGVAEDVILTALGVRVGDAVGLWIVAAAGVVLLIGASLLTRKGEVRVQLESGDSSSDRARLQQQLTDINRLLARAARGRG